VGRAGGVGSEDRVGWGVGVEFWAGWGVDVEFWAGWDTPLGRAAPQAVSNSIRASAIKAEVERSILFVRK
jgi:hypothetical protein